MEKNILRIEGSFIAPNRGCFSFLSIMVPTLAVLPNFLPEIPHMWIFSRSILYGSSVAFASYLRNYEPDYSFISDEKVDAGARIESVHMTYNAYYIALALAVTLGVATLSIASPEAYTDINEQILLNIASRINLVYMILGLFLGMSSQVFIGMYRAQQELRKIKSPRQNERHTAQPE